MSFALQRYKNLVLPVAMLAGAAFYKWMGYLTFLSPYLIFVMLLITYCKVEPHDFRMGRFQGVLLCLQMSLSAAVYFLLDGWNHTVSTGVFISVFIPTATAAPVITSMLGGSITRTATYSLACNLVVAVAGPAILAAIGEHHDMTFSQSFNLICSRVFPLLIMPMVLAFVLRYTWRRVHDFIANHQPVSFYIWALSLFIVMGSSVSFVVKNFKLENVVTMIALALGALVVCLVQFYLGRKLGRRFGDAVSGGQSLGQKNTLFGIWVAMTYLNPISSIAPASYVVWQNIMNSIQLMRHKASK